MTDPSRTNQELLEENALLKKRIKELEKSEAERKRAEEELHESEFIYKMLFTNSAEGILVAELQTKQFIYANPALCRMFGCTEKEILQLRVEDIHPKESFEHVLAEFDAQARGEKMWALNIPCLCKDGSLFYANISSTSIVLDGVKCNVGFFTDITERKRNEEAIAHSHDLMRYIIEHNRSAIAVHDRDLKYIYVSQRYLQEYGVKEKDVIGKHHYDVFPDLPQKWRDVHQKALSGEVSSAEDDPYVREDGSVDWTRWECRPWYEADGSIGGIIIYTEVITDRKRAEEKLRALSSRQEAILAAVPEIIMEVDNNKVYVWANSVGIEFFGENVIGKEAAFYFEGEQDTYYTVSPLFNGAEDIIYVESWQRRRDGEKRLLAWWCRVLKDESGQVTGALSSARDITDHKRADEELQANKAQMSNALEIAHLGHWEYDIANDLFTFNDYFYKIFRTTVDQVGGYTMHSAEYAHRFVYPDDIDMVGEETRKAIETMDPNFNRQIEHRMLYADGTVGYITVRFFIVKDSRGRTIKTYGVNQDITNRKQAEEELRLSEERLKDIMFRIADWVWETDENGVYTYSSQKGVDLFGESNGDIIGKTPFDFMPLDEAKRVAAIFSEIVATKAPIMDLENWNIRRNGERICLLTNGVPILDEKGNLKGYRGIDKDITETKRAAEQLQETLESLRKAVRATIQVMVSAVETRDPYTAGHQIRSADLARAIATELELPQRAIEGLRMASTIHDIGKLSVPVEILSKPTKLSELEFSLIKEHVQKGYEILKDVESPWPLAEIVYQHHERIDGSGYPRNLKGEEILIEARILAVADVVESMASHRPYRPALGLNAALEEIENNKGTLYDADVVDACLRLFREKGYQLEGTRL